MTADFETTDLAEVLTYAGKFGSSGKADNTEGAVGFHQGLIESWDSTTGANTVRVLGTTINDLPVLTTADSILLNEGDLVAVLRFQSTYFILGRIAPPGGGAALSIRSGFESSDVVLDSSAGDPTNTWLSRGTMSLDDIYVGSSRRCLVIMNAAIQAENAQGFLGFEVSGASSIGPNRDQSATVQVNNDVATGSTVGSTASATRVLDASMGLQQGFNHFEPRYRYELFNDGTSALIALATITVFPF